MSKTKLTTKLDEVKVLRDPIHSYIHVEYEVIWKCIDSPWVQRLRRIRQLGGAFMVYHTADHTRFGHSLGVYEIVRRMVHEVKDLDDNLTEEEKIVAMLAALLHDVGHGPFSHAFESVLALNHEKYSCMIIEQEDSSLAQLLESYQPGLSKQVASVIRHEHDNNLLNQIISSQLDADRMDYLLRDAYFTGTKYGEFDLERIFRVMRVYDKKRLVIKKSGVYAIENYIMARYHMYWQVYYHPVARSYEAMIELLFNRLKDLHEKGKLPTCVAFFAPLFVKGAIPLETYLELDESVCFYGFHQLVNCEDPIAKDLARRLLNRDLFIECDASGEHEKKVKEALKKHGYDENYYYHRDKVTQKPYDPYKENNEFQTITILMEDGSCKDLSKASSLVSSLTKGRKEMDGLIFYPQEVPVEL